ncbi:hypothetical protein CEQ83_02195 [Priestia megaterium]|uniref:DUF4145 domain-containing protein n=1 Tax=Priestia megaterium TaxID=1404 RepID=UPI0012A8BF58|nr:DUF4145 domain-containing protein [Priestia megaterium]QFY71375.1 hypothetical protein CEQ83_02195 [Priestia megaterium]
MSEYGKFKKRVYCRQCKHNTNHQILLKHTVDEEIPEYNFYMTEDYMICECMGCETVNFVREYDDPSMHYYDAEEGEEIHHEDIQVFPPKPLTDKEESYEVKQYKHLPPLLKTLYKQVVANVELKYYLLAAAGLRMIIEGICNDLSIKKGYIIDDATGKRATDENGNEKKSSNLNGRINGLSEAKILTEGQTTILHIIRGLGNQTVHKLEEPKRGIILDALEIVEHTFTNIYELKKYDSLRDQYAKKS